MFHNVSEFLPLLILIIVATVLRADDTVNNYSIAHIYLHQRLRFGCCTSRTTPSRIGKCTLRFSF